MELKMNYQYTYFIYPFIIKENMYKSYIEKLLKNKNYRLKTFEKEKDCKLYEYFLPSARKILFSSFSSEKSNQAEELSVEKKAKILSKNKCNIFEYNLGTDIQAKVDDKKGIYFKVRKIEIICFDTGICFLCIKTYLEDESTFSDLLNFNYKFKDSYFQTSELKEYEKIRIQENMFSNAETFNEFIENIAGTKIEMKNFNINDERFITYSYLCIDQSAWNNDQDFQEIEHYFIKYANNLSAYNNINFDQNSVEKISKLKYAKIGLTKSSISLFASNYNMNNYTVLPYEFENQYFYTYILNLYKKIYLKSINYKYKEGKNIKKIMQEFTKFTKEIWMHEITEDTIGTELNNKLEDVLELEKLYNEVKCKYDILYKDLNMKKNVKVNLIILVILIFYLIINIYNLIILNNR